MHAPQILVAIWLGLSAAGSLVMLGQENPKWWHHFFSVVALAALLYWGGFWR